MSYIIRNKSNYVNRKSKIGFFFVGIYKKFAYFLRCKAVSNEPVDFVHLLPIFMLSAVELCQKNNLLQPSTPCLWQTGAQVGGL